MTHSEGVNSVSFSPDGKYVVSGSADGTARMWDATSGLQIAKVTHFLYHPNEVYSVAFSLDSKGSLVVRVVAPI